MSKKSSVVIISRHDAMNSGRIEKHWDSTAVSDLACDHDHGMAFDGGEEKLQEREGWLW